MPSTATITAFYSFTANTKARATQVNNNFDVFRGHIIPINTATTTAADNTWDLGSLEYNWRNVYAKNFWIGHTSSGWSISENTTSSDHLVINQSGTSRFIVGKDQGYTTSAAYDQFARSALLSTNTSVNDNCGTITVQCINRPVMVGLSSFDVFTASAGSTIYGSYIGARNNSGSTNASFVTFGIKRNGTLIGEQTIVTYADTIGASGFSNRIPANLTFFDFPGAGTHNYSLFIGVPTTTCIADIVSARVFAKQI